ncbi:MAG: hypothetical protein ACI9OJ_002943 [Myxococcota bacterium]
MSSRSRHRSSASGEFLGGVSTRRGGDEVFAVDDDREFLEDTGDFTSEGSALRVNPKAFVG